MVKRRVVPCLRVRSGRAEHEVKFEGLEDPGDPVAILHAFQAQGADEVFVERAAAPANDPGSFLAFLESVRERLAIPMTVGTAATVDEAEDWLLAGADRVAVRFDIPDNDGLLAKLVAVHGRERVVAEVSGNPTATETAEEAARLGAGEILLVLATGDWPGIVGGVCQAVHEPVATLGVTESPQEMLAAFEAGATAVLAASVFADQVVTVADIKRRLVSLGADIRQPSVT
jgi:imidazole glycerol phosphate synthase subunit HisF